MEDRLTFSRMTVEDLPEVLRIEQESFPSPWSQAMFERDILHNPLAHINTAREYDRIVGYYSLWKIVDEGHLVTLAVDPPLRRRGLGELICREVIRQAGELGVRKITLEVRETNRDAIRLYSRFGFIKAGVRLKYYEDTTDAWIMDLEVSPHHAHEASA
ncbi:ribosomal protein S18-alanine N-acetyltransferase [bacterium]|nr:ribosomal protein S18-alanine N-acetyltransferase [bacterium]